MACGSCSKKRRRSPNTNINRSQDYDLAAGMNIKSLNSKQINARLEVFKRKFCSACTKRYDCDYQSYLNCKGTKPKQ